MLLCLILLSLLALSLTFGQDSVSTRLHFAVIEASGPRSPFIVDDSIIFTYQQEEPARFVAVAFAHEDFTVMHPYKRYTPEGGSEVFVLAYPIPPSEETLIYRVIVDGLWIHDPANSEVIRDVNGIPLSRYRIPPKQTLETYPLVKNDGAVTFTYTSRPGQTVTVAGTFNSWDPFMYPLRETEPGHYRCTIYLPPGEFVYHFIVNGSAINDPLNPRDRFDTSGNRYSYFAIEAEQDPEIIQAEKKRLIDRIPFIGGS